MAANATQPHKSEKESPTHFPPSFLLSAFMGKVGIEKFTENFLIETFWETRGQQILQCASRVLVTDIIVAHCFQATSVISATRNYWEWFQIPKRQF